MSFSSISARPRPMTRTSGALQRHRASKSAQNPTQTVPRRGVWRGQPSTSGGKKSEKLPPGKRCLTLPMLSIAAAGLEPARGIPPQDFKSCASANSATRPEVPPSWMCCVAGQRSHRNAAPQETGTCMALCRSSSECTGSTPEAGSLSRRYDSLSPAPCLQLDSGNQIRHCPSAWHDLMGATQQIVQFVLRIDTQQLIECGNNVSWNQR